MKLRTYVRSKEWKNNAKWKLIFFLGGKCPDKTTYIVQKPQLNRSSSACAEHFSIYRGRSIPVVGLRKGSSLSLRSSQRIQWVKVAEVTEPTTSKYHPTYPVMLSTCVWMSVHLRHSVVGVYVCGRYDVCGRRLCIVRTVCGRMTVYESKWVCARIRVCGWYSACALSRGSIRLPCMLALSPTFSFYSTITVSGRLIRKSIYTGLSLSFSYGIYIELRTATPRSPGALASLFCSLYTSVSCFFLLF